jgi:hypothetical protein
MRTLSIRGQLMLFSCVMCLVLLVLVWALSSRLLQPRYNSYIRAKLDTKLDTIVSMMDDAIAKGTVLSSRDFFTLTLNADFWAGMDDAISEGTLNLTNTCVDISDSTLRSVVSIENLHPCLLHNSTGNMFGGGSGGLPTKDTGELIRMRARCFADGTFYYIKETESASQMIVGRTRPTAATACWCPPASRRSARRAACWACCCRGSRRCCSASR